MVEGLLRLTDLHDDYYEFLESEYALAGNRTGKVYRFGQMLKVRIVNVDLPKRQIQLEPVDARKTGRRRPSGKPGKPGRRGGRGGKRR
jgi:ribonuclease R